MDSKETYDADRGEAFSLTPAQLCRQTAMEYIGLGGKSSGKVRRKLEDEGFASELIEPCLEKLRQDAYIDDVALARRVLRERRGRRAEAHAALLIRMLNQGIPEHTAESIVYTEAVNETTLLSEYLQEHGARELSALADAEPYSPDYQKLYGRLGRRAEGRGFSASLIHRILHEMINERREG